MFFDNVGGDILNQALANLARGARVAVCGYIASDYAEHKTGPANYRHLVYQRARMQGFVVFDYWQRFAEAETALTAWYRQGRCTTARTSTKGSNACRIRWAACLPAATGVSVCAGLLRTQCIFRC